jgi:glucosamine 6-phosphate synthetase-like amidotransferase/phosphosugar isomerase protein
MPYYIHSSLIYNSQKLKTTQMSFNRRTDTENVVHLHNGVLSAIKNNDFMKFVGKWMKLRNIIVSEVTQSQKNIHGMYSLISQY